MRPFGGLGQGKRGTAKAVLRHGRFLPIATAGPGRLGCEPSIVGYFVVKRSPNMV